MAQKVFNRHPKGIQVIQSATKMYQKVIKKVSKRQYKYYISFYSKAIQRLIVDKSLSKAPKRHSKSIQKIPQRHPKGNKSEICNDSCSSLESDWYL